MADDESVGSGGTTSSDRPAAPAAGAQAADATAGSFARLEEAVVQLETTARHRKAAKRRAAFRVVD